MESLWSIIVVALLAGGAVPGVVLSCRGSGLRRLIGLQLVSGTSVMILIALSAIVNQSSYLVVPLVLAVLASTGTLVYTRLLRPESITPPAGRTGAAEQ
ncbi:monovalent cation/H+ antiporter complex subunit F [Sinomonas albida]|uniref:monovalent cation/H+ antiporter complex subunit F n=1 Tax=Sinomonas albida TaxID=369942 RepID=UPI00301725C6